jgi:hypothetical protein
MSLLRNIVLEASSHTQTKTVFRIPSSGKLLMPDIRLCNFGVSSKVNGTGLESYCYGQGIYALIKSVRLYSNNILLDQCNDCSRYMALQNLKGAPDTVLDIKQKTLCSNVNLQDSWFGTVSGLKPITHNLLGLLSLKSCLPLLESMDVLYNMPGELRVEIEYNTDKTEIFSNDGNGRGNDFSFTISQPTCVYTQETNEEQIAAIAADVPKKYMWFTWEREYIAALTGGINNTPRVRAFDNKFVDLLVVQKIRDPNVSQVKLGFGRSDALPNERLNYIINGSKQLMFNGQDIAARSTAALVDSLGDLSIPFNGWTKMVPAGDTSMTGDLALLNGQLSWACVSIGKVINRLDLELYFTGVGAVDVWTWGRILKIAQVDDKGNWVVGYVANGSQM